MIFEKKVFDFNPIILLFTRCLCTYWLHMMYFVATYSLRLAGMFSQQCNECFSMLFTKVTLISQSFYFFKERLQSLKKIKIQGHCCHFQHWYLQHINFSLLKIISCKICFKLKNSNHFLELRRVDTDLKRVQPYVFVLISVCVTKYHM